MKAVYEVGQKLYRINHSYHYSVEKCVIVEVVKTKTGFSYWVKTKEYGPSAKVGTDESELFIDKTECLKEVIDYEINAICNTLKYSISNIIFEAARLK